MTFPAISITKNKELIVQQKQHNQEESRDRLIDSLK